MKIYDEFKTYQEVDQAVNEYFKENNHTVRIVDSAKNKDSSLIYKYIEWQCVHYGTDDNLVGDSRKRKRVCLISFNCTMCLRINYDSKLSCFKVKKLVEEHMHETNLRTLL